MQSSPCKLLASRGIQVHPVSSTQSRRISGSKSNETLMQMILSVRPSGQTPFAFHAWPISSALTHIKYTLMTRLCKHHTVCRSRSASYAEILIICDWTWVHGTYTIKLPISLVGPCPYKDATEAASDICMWSRFCMYLKITVCAIRANIKRNSVTLFTYDNENRTYLVPVSETLVCHGRRG